MNPEFKKYTLRDWQEIAYHLTLYVAATQVCDGNKDVGSDACIADAFKSIQEYKQNHPDDDYISDIRRFFTELAKTK